MCSDYLYKSHSAKIKSGIKYNTYLILQLNLLPNKKILTLASEHSLVISINKKPVTQLNHQLTDNR